MISRAYNKRIEIWGTTLVPDGFGGNYTENELITKSWARIESSQKSARRLTELGINDATKAAIFYVRYRNDHQYTINDFIKYKGKDYTIQTVTEVNLQETEIELVGITQDNAS